MLEGITQARGLLDRRNSTSKNALSIQSDKNMSFSIGLGFLLDASSKIDLTENGVWKNFFYMWCMYSSTKPN